MVRALSALLAVLLVLLAAGGLVLYFSYGVSDAPPARVAIEGLHQNVEIAWRDDAAIAHIRADSLQDAYAALGYVHGARRAWTTVLWRRTALGRLGEWFGNDVLRLDSLARQVGFADFARSTYADLPGSQKSLLEAYTRGMNAALRTDAVKQGSPLVLLDEEPLPWEPWHTLAVERLFAWLAAPPFPPETAEVTDTAVAGFAAANRHLHRWLAAHGFVHSMAFVVEDSTGTHFLQRQVYGASALPVYQEVTLEVTSRPLLLAASLPGTPFFLSGRAGERAWAVLPTSTPHLEHTAYDSSAVVRSHERLLGLNGTEHLLTVRRMNGALLIGAPSPYAPPDTLTDTPEAVLPPPEAERTAPPPADSIWQVRWNGFAPGTDFEAWQALLEGRSPSFRLLEGDGLMMDSTGAHQVLGQPQVTERFPSGLVVGNTRWTPYAAEQLRTLADPDDRAALSRWIDNDSSAWAAQTAPRMLASIDSLARLRGTTLASEEQTGVFSEALTYLRNWDFRYDRASIGASIHDTWLAEYRRQAGAPPSFEADTTSYTENLLRYRTLERAVTALGNTFGEDLRQWRWENVMPDERYFPGWSSDTLSLNPFREMRRTRYAPIRLPGRGHPSSLSWGPSPVEVGRPSPAAWEAWISTTSWSRLHVRRRRFPTDTFLGRYRIPEYRPDPIVLDTAFAAEHTTTLLPPTP